MAKEIRINDNGYAQILQQAVSEIQTARTTVARQVNTPSILYIGISGSYSLIEI